MKIAAILLMVGELAPCQSTPTMRQANGPDSPACTCRETALGHTAAERGEPVELLLGHAPQHVALFFDIGTLVVCPNDGGVLVSSECGDSLAPELPHAADTSGLAAIGCGAPGLGQVLAVDGATGGLPTHSRGRTVETRSPPSLLTRREIEIATLIARGFTNRDIAEHLVIAHGTAQRHVANILTKLGFTSRAQIAVWVVERGLCETAHAD